MMVQAKMLLLQATRLSAALNLAASELKTPMPRDGSLTLSDVCESTLAMVCEACGRRGRYRIERLMAEHGDAKLTDLLVQSSRWGGRYVRRSQYSTTGQTGLG